MKQSEKQVVNAPVGWFLTGKVHTIEHAFDELAILEAKVKEPDKSSAREKRALIDVLSDYKLGLPTNTLAQYKADVHGADMWVCMALRNLHLIECFNIEEVEKIDRFLGYALENLLKVYAIEETRKRAYSRIGEPQPQKSKQPKPEELETEKARYEA